MSISQPPKITVPFAGSGQKNTIPVPSQIGITAGAASYTDGFPPLTMIPKAAGGTPPAGMDMNGILYSITQAMQFHQAGGSFPYDSSFAAAVGGYPVGAIVQATDHSGFWLNQSANNTTDPEAFGAGWLPLDQQGSASVTMTSANVTLNALQAAKSIITITGTLTTNLNLIFPNWVKEWTIVNKASGGFTITAKTASGTGINLSAGANQTYGDAINIYSSLSGGGGGGGISTNSLFRIGASVSGGNLTLTVDPCTLDFRSNNITSGAVTTLTISNQMSITIPSISNLGLQIDKPGFVYLLALNDNGNIKLGVCNIRANINEYGVYNAVALDGVQNNYGYIYATSALSNVTLRVLGSVNIVRHSATYDTQPLGIQATGGGISYQSVMSSSSVGKSHRWIDRVTQLNFNTIYTNDDEAILHGVIKAQTNANLSGAKIVYGNGSIVELQCQYIPNASGYANVIIQYQVPPDETYKLMELYLGTSVIPSAWFELRRYGAS